MDLDLFLLKFIKRYKKNLQRYLFCIISCSGGNSAIFVFKKLIITGRIPFKEKMVSR